jgi:hypothetical protein
VIPFEVPARFLAQFAAGSVIRIGTTLRDKGTMQIVAHLQEAALLPAAIGTGLPGGLLLAATQAVQGVMFSSRLARVQQALAVVQGLNVATLAVGVVGLGVSTAGFALVNQRLGNIEKQLGTMQAKASRIECLGQRIDARQTADARGKLASLLSRAEEAWVRKDAELVWRALDPDLSDAHHVHRFLACPPGGKSLFLDHRFALEEAVAAYEAALMLAGLRIQVLLLLEQMPAALHFSRDVRDWAVGAIGGLRTTDIVDLRWKALAEAKGLKEDDARSRLSGQVVRMLDTLQHARDCLDARPALLEDLAHRPVSGREYIEDIRTRKEEMVLVLPVGS